MNLKRPLLLSLLALLACAPATIPARQAPPPNTEELPTLSNAAAESLLVDVRSLEPSIQVEMR
jgi:hypothetical protein